MKFTLPERVSIKVGEGLPDVILDKGTQIPCVLSLMTDMGEYEQEAIFVNRQFKATVLQTTAMIQEGGSCFVVGAANFVEVPTTSLPTTVDLDGTLFYVNPPSLLLNLGTRQQSGEDGEAVEKEPEKGDRSNSSNTGQGIFVIQ
jgi:hypothetical protein